MLGSAPRQTLALVMHRPEDVPARNSPLILRACPFETCPPSTPRSTPSARSLRSLGRARPSLRLQAAPEFVSGSTTALIPMFRAGFRAPLALKTLIPPARVALARVPLVRVSRAQPRAIALASAPTPPARPPGGSGIHARRGAHPCAPAPLHVPRSTSTSRAAARPAPAARPGTGLPACRAPQVPAQHPRQDLRPLPAVVSPAAALLLRAIAPLPRLMVHPSVDHQKKMGILVPLVREVPCRPRPPGLAAAKEFHLIAPAHPASPFGSRLVRPQSSSAEPIDSLACGSLEPASPSALWQAARVPPCLDLRRST